MLSTRVSRELRELTDSYFLFLWYLDDLLEWNSSIEKPLLISGPREGIFTLYKVIPKPEEHIRDARLYTSAFKRGLNDLIIKMAQLIVRLGAALEENGAGPQSDLPAELGPIKYFAVNYWDLTRYLQMALQIEEEDQGKAMLKAEVRRVVEELLRNGVEASRFETLVHIND